MNESRHFISNKHNFSVFCLICGCILTVFPDFIVRFLAWTVGMFCAVCGIGKILHGLHGGADSGGKLLFGVLSLVIGCYITLRPERVFSVLPVLAGILFLAEGLSRFRAACLLKKNGAGVNAVLPLVFAVLMCAAALFFLIRPFSTVRLTVRVVGVFLILDAVGKILTEKKLLSLRKEASRTGADGNYNAEFRDIS